MRKKFLTFLFAICLIMPCAIMLTACGGDPAKEAEAVTIKFELDEDHSSSFQDWEIDESTNTYKTTYMNGFVWDWYYFKVTATTANGYTTQLQEATESNPMGFKIDTNMPEGDRLPVGTYTFRLYCEEFNNGQYKSEACESETYTIIIEKETIELQGGWEYNTSNTYNKGSEIQVGCYLYPYFSDGSSGSLEEVGIKNFDIINNTDYTSTATNVGDYTAKVEYEADTTNFNYIGDGLPEKEFKWSIEKADIGDFIDLDLWLGSSSYTYSQGETFTVELIENNFPTDLPLNYIGMGGTYTASQPGTYTCWPIFEQTDTENYTLITDYSEELKFIWHISAQKLYVNSDTVGLYSTVFEYTGNPIPIDTANVWTHSDLEVDRVVGETQKINVGTYNVRVYVKPAEGYVIEGSDYIDIEWRIKKQIVEFNFVWYLSGVENGTTVGYTGISRTPVPATNLPLSYVRHYDMQGNELKAEDIIEIGRYRTVAIPEYNLDNYELVNPERLVLEWEIVKGEYQVTTSGVWNVHYIAGEHEEIVNGTGLFYECVARENGQVSLTFNEGCITPNEGLTYKFSKDDGVTFVDEAELVFDASVVDVYCVTVVVENENSELYNPVDVTKLKIWIYVVEAVAE